MPGTVDEENIVANYDAGLLKITIPKTEESKPRHIPVK